MKDNYITGNAIAIIAVGSVLIFGSFVYAVMNSFKLEDQEHKELVEKAMSLGKKSYELILLNDKDFHYDFKKSDSLYEIEQKRIIKSLYK